MMDDSIAAKLLLAVLAISAFNTGLIWLVQVVHYPVFLKIPMEGYTAYQQFHMRSISWIVAPSMVFELFATGILLFHAQYFLSPIYWATVVLLAVVWIMTFFVAVPLHGSLVGSYDAQKIVKLIQFNWLRTIGWTLRTFLLLWMTSKLV